MFSSKWTYQKLFFFLLYFCSGFFVQFHFLFLFTKNDGDSHEGRKLAINNWQQRFIADDELGKETLNKINAKNRKSQTKTIHLDNSIFFPQWKTIHFWAILEQNWIERNAFNANNRSTQCANILRKPEKGAKFHWFQMLWSFFPHFISFHLLPVLMEQCWWSHSLFLWHFFFVLLSHIKVDGMFYLSTQMVITVVTFAKWKQKKKKKT